MSLTVWDCCETFNIVKEFSNKKFFQRQRRRATTMKLSMEKAYNGVSTKSMRRNNYNW